MEILITKINGTREVHVPFTPLGRAAAEGIARSYGAAAEEAARAALVDRSGVSLARAAGGVWRVAAVLAAGSEAERAIAERLCKLAAAVMDAADELPKAIGVAS